MIIAFWSPKTGQAGTTTNMLTIGLCAALQHKLKVLLAATDTAQRQLKQYLLPEYNAETVNTRRGTSDLMRLARNGLLQPQSIANYTTPILKSSLLDVLSGIALRDQRASEIDVFKAILTMSKSTYDLVLLDVTSGLNTPYSRAILAFSDAVVINASQNIAMLDALRALRKSDDADLLAEAFICIGHYESSSKLGRRQFAKLLATKSIVVVPRYSALIDVINTGNMLEFFGRHYYRGKLAKDHDFFNAVSRSTEQLLKAKQLIE